MLGDVYCKHACSQCCYYKNRNDYTLPCGWNLNVFVCACEKWRRWMLGKERRKKKKSQRKRRLGMKGSRGREMRWRKGQAEEDYGGMICFYLLASEEQTGTSHAVCVCVSP